MNRSECLAAAHAAVADRPTTHGDPESTFGTIADFWTAYLDHPISAIQVAGMMVLFKMARHKANPFHDDHATDAAGYAACAAELAAAAEADAEARWAK